MESLSTLKFANRAKNIKNEAHLNEDLDQKALLRKYEKEIKKSGTCSTIIKAAFNAIARARRFSVSLRSFAAHMRSTTPRRLHGSCSCKQSLLTFRETLRHEEMAP